MYVCVCIYIYIYYIYIYIYIYIYPLIIARFRVQYDQYVYCFAFPGRNLYIHGSIIASGINFYNFFKFHNANTEVVSDL